MKQRASSRLTLADRLSISAAKSARSARGHQRPILRRRGALQRFARALPHAVCLFPQAAHRLADAMGDAVADDPAQILLEVPTQGLRDLADGGRQHDVALRPSGAAPDRQGPALRTPKIASTVGARVRTAAGTASVVSDEQAVLADLRIRMNDAERTADHDADVASGMGPHLLARRRLLLQHMVHCGQRKLRQAAAAPGSSLPPPARARRRAACWEAVGRTPGCSAP